ncbi:hypothetical protein F2S72_01520 [Pseudomonas syringae pv. actinidiae]|nr:hypothetical protein [Pseudomonas syringae pv. actinidiae]
MHLTGELNNSVLTIRNARIALAAAERAVQEDKQRRSYSRWARLVDWLFNTKVEARFSDAQAELSEATGAGDKIATRWIIETAKADLSLSPGDSQRHAEQTVRLSKADKRKQKVGHWYGLADSAHCMLLAAASNCDSASNMEMLDLVTSNKGISLLSSLETSDAADSIRVANEAVRSLADALPQRAGADDIDQPTDLMDLILDLSIDPPLDFLSWFNLTKLDDAAAECRRVAEQIAPLRAKLHSTLADVTSKCRAELQMLRDVEAPYLIHATSMVPDLIKCPVPQGFD